MTMHPRPKHLSDTVFQILAAYKDEFLASEPEELLSGNYYFGKTKAMKELKERARLAASTDVTVLITGENGTGKSLLAKWVHEQSKRFTKPFVAIDCAAIPENLIESELFGYKRGAFTGADRDKLGKLELANGGTIFFDEIGELPFHVQAKLMFAIQEKKISPLGSTEERTLNIRIIAATNQNLVEKVRLKQFRQDLFYRLSVFSLQVVPLKDRMIDLTDLCSVLISKFNTKYSRCIQGIDDDVIDAFKKYVWPGNIRELENAIEHAFVISHGVKLNFNSFPAQILITADSPADTHYRSELYQFEKKYLLSMLENYGWKINLTSSEIGMSKPTLIKKMRAYGLAKANGANMSDRVV